MTGPSNAEFSVEDVSVGAHAHGFGSTPDGRSFAFRVRGKSLRVEVYRSDLAQAVPDDLDVDAVAERDVTDVDLSDERSIVAADTPYPSSKRLGSGRRRPSARLAAAARHHTPAIAARAAGQRDRPEVTVRN